MTTPLDEMRNLAAGQGSEVSEVRVIQSRKSHTIPEKKLTPQARWRARNPLAYWCHSATASAIKRGILEIEPCAVCGDPKTDFHHTGSYLHPLEGIFLCRSHHKQAHKAMKCETAA
ncbi:hypothetical protein NKI12_28725 [Mesorhizobium australicum]|uniref:Uncharacterized protein n=1 Tax=Mesorhizobium australicum TaxID=536018 RepID=A0ACC6T7A0_9HYPH